VKHSFALICLVIMLSACSDAPAPNASTAQIPVAERLQDLPVVGVELQDVVDTYVLGGNRTDLQRDAMTAKLVGSIVSWRFKVYDIAKEDGRYRVMSELMESSAAGSFGKFAVVAFVTPREEQDIQILLKLQTGNEVEILGRVDGVSARTALILSPAELVR
jgi:hypothetical protein